MVVQDRRAGKPGGTRTQAFGCRIAADSLDGQLSQITVAGELDLSAAPRLRETIDLFYGEGDGGARQLVLDLRDVTFFDSSGLRALWYARGKAQESGSTLFLSQPSEAVMSLLRLTKLDKIFSVLEPD